MTIKEGKTYFTYDSNSLVMDLEKAASEIGEETTLEVVVVMTDTKGYSSSTSFYFTVLPASNSTQQQIEDEEEVTFIPKWDFSEN